MKTYISDIKPKALITLLVVLSVISTIHIWYHYQLEIEVCESMAIIQAPDTMGLKEVGFTDFVINAVRQIIVFFV